ncbi:MAG: hypothetical protein QG628_783 [Patescibacteria group bacterium]|nr:hypothetical protein [Patescibacteria group bacterium]
MKLKKPSFSKNTKSAKNKTPASLNVWNKRLAVLHGVQGIAILLLASKAVSWPITTSFLTIDTIATKAAGNPVLAPAAQTIGQINIGYLVALFFFMSATAHIVIATKYRKTYESDLKKGINKARWIEYGLSASTMMVAIALLSGVYDLSSLIMIFVLDLIMNLMGLAMEVYNQGSKKVNWLAYWIGCLAGIVPWIVFAIYVTGANVYGSGGIPTFVYFIYASMFIFFNSFAINMYLQYKKSGKWADYLYGERTYMILSLVAKTALAWQVFFGSLRP